jgi:hypothetical protein
VGVGARLARQSGQSLRAAINEAPERVTRGFARAVADEMLQSPCGTRMLPPHPLPANAIRPSVSEIFLLCCESAPTRMYVVVYRAVQGLPCHLLWGICQVGDSKIGTGAMNNLERMHVFERRADKSYRLMFDATTASDAAALYNETKDALFGGIRIAYKVRDPAALDRLTRSLWAVRGAFRSQFP